MHWTILTQSTSYKKQEDQQWHELFHLSTDIKKKKKWPGPSVCYHEHPAPESEVWNTITNSQQSQTSQYLSGPFQKYFENALSATLISDFCYSD